MRVVIAFGLLAAAVAADAKPVDVNALDANAMDGRASARAMRYRMRGVRACIAAHRPDGTHDPSDAFVAQNCQCAVDRFIAGRDPADLPSLRGDPKLVEENFAACRAERAGEQAPASASAEADRGAKDPDAPASPGPWERLRGLDPAAWLNRSGLPVWAWAAIAVFVLLLGLALRGRQGRGHLMGPPRSMRPPPGVNPGPDSRKS